MEQLRLSLQRAQTPVANTFIGSCQILCDSTKIDTGVIHMRAIPGDKDDYTGFSTSGEEYSNQADFPMPKPEGQNPVIKGLGWLDAFTAIFGGLYLAFDNPLTATGVQGHVYFQAGANGLTITGAGIDNKSSSNVYITSVVLQIGDGELQRLYQYQGGTNGSALPGISSSLEVASPTIYAGKTFSVSISAQTYGSNGTMFGTGYSYWQYQPYP